MLSTACKIFRFIGLNGFIEFIGYPVPYRAAGTTSTRFDFGTEHHLGTGTPGTEHSFDYLE